MIRPTILVFLISHALLPYVDSTSIPVNDEPFAGFSNVAPAKKSLRADKTMANEERVAPEWIKRPLVTYRNNQLDEALKTILLPIPEASQSMNTIETALQHKGTSNVLKKFKNHEETLLNAFTKHYGGFSFAISTLLHFEDSEGPLGANAKKLLEMQLNIWNKNQVSDKEAFNQLELIKKGILNKEMTYLERYIKRKVSSDDATLFEVLEEGFGGRYKFSGLVEASLKTDGSNSPEKAMAFARRYISFLTSKRDKKTMDYIMFKMEDISGKINTRNS